MPCYKPVRLGPDQARVGLPHVVPCGRCIGCHLERSRQWAIRGQHEQQLHQHSCSLLLTIREANYRPEDIDAYCAHQRGVHKSEIQDAGLPTASNIAQDRALNRAQHRSGGAVDSPTGTVRVPYASGTRERPSVAAPEGTGESLSIRDHQLFMKRLLSRLREKGPIKPVRFMMCGEYGEKLGRPHYHYIIFGYDFPDKYYYKKSRTGYNLYRSAFLEEIWPHGHADIGECSFETIAYVARYVTKKITGEMGDAHYRREFPDGTPYWLQPEFNAMSRNPGIGSAWFDKYNSSVYPHDRVIATRGDSNYPSRPPRYYDKLLQELDPNALERVKEKRQERKPNADAQHPRRLRAGEKIAHAKLTNRKLEK